MTQVPKADVTKQVRAAHDPDAAEQAAIRHVQQARARMQDMEI